MTARGLSDIFSWFRRSRPRAARLFANGEDDDLPGLAAAIENRPVIVADRTIGPGEPIVIRGANLRLSCYFLFIRGAEDRRVTPPPGVAVLYEARPNRRVIVEDCTIRMGADIDAVAFALGSTRP